MIKISELKKNPNNPRLIKDDKFQKLVKSIQDFPKMMELRPIIINDQNIVLGGNMRLAALKELGYKEIPDEWVKQAKDLTQEQQNEFIVKDNVSFGAWDWDTLANEWESDDLADWGLDVHESIEDEDGVEYSEEYGEDFSLPDGDKAPFQQMTFTLANEQAIRIQNAIADIKQTQEYKYAETMGNENSNGNALYLIVMQWEEQRK